MVHLFSCSMLNVMMLCILTCTVRAEDKSGYSLLNPTPDRLLRDMTTDRPDITEVPFTVDAGRFQIETTSLGFARSRPDLDGAVSEGYELFASNLRIGLTHNTEATIMFQPYGSQRISGPYGAVNAFGTGALVLRAKFNLWGNDTFLNPKATAFALLPYVSIPTHRGNGISPDSIDGGLFAFFAVDLGSHFSLGINAGTHSIKNLDNSGRHAEFSGSASLGYAWTEKFTTYVEVATQIGSQNPLGDVTLVGGGLAYRVTPNLQLDGGVNFGVTQASDRVRPFIGFSARF
jgi:Putative MetA-pathway of phenol degradation